MDFERANQVATKILEEGKEELFPRLIAECLSYLYYLRAKLGFLRISLGEVKDDLAHDAVSDALLRMKERNLPFSRCLQNAFRDQCRQRIRILREQNVNDLMSGKLAIIFERHPEAASPEARVEQGEIVEKAREILDRHEPFSKQVVCQHMRGATYPELVERHNKSLNECKRVYAHDLYHMRKEMARYRKDL